MTARASRCTKGNSCKTRGNPCSVDGCSATVKARGLCFKHGGKPECLREGRTTPTRGKSRLCSKHAVKVSCTVPDLQHPGNRRQEFLHQTRCLWILHNRRVHQQRHHNEGQVWETRHQDSGVLCGGLRHQGVCARAMPKTWNQNDLLFRQLQHCRPSTAVAAKGKCARRKAAPRLP